MAVSIRLNRGGSKKRPFYRIVIADSRSPRDGRFIERVGHYNPMAPSDNPERVVLKEDRIQEWLKVGAQPTDRVRRFLVNAGIVEARPYNETPKKSAPKAKAQERMREAEEARKALEEAAATPQA